MLRVAQTIAPTSRPFAAGPGLAKGSRDPTGGPSMHRIARRAPSRARALILLALAVTIAAFGASPTGAEPEPAPEPAVPTFVNGLSQAVFPTGSANWINQELWVETTVDSDF